MQIQTLKVPVLQLGNLIAPEISRRSYFLGNFIAESLPPIVVAAGAAAGRSGGRALGLSPDAAPLV